VKSFGVQNCVCYGLLGTDGYRTLFGPARTDRQILYGRKISLLKLFLKKYEDVGSMTVMYN
jgi:hypothetical protein